MPIYGSVDIRDSHWKVAAVDANQYPAGFNNLSQSSIGEHLSDAIGDVKHVHIWPEKHTRNQPYLDNISALSKILERQGYKVTNGIIELESSGPISINGSVPDLVLLNNDLTDGPIGTLGVPVLPPQEMGWYQRKKSSHFEALQPFIDEAAEILGVDPWLLSTSWFVSEEKCLEKETCRTLLAAEVDNLLHSIQEKYDDLGVLGKPKIFMKNNSGTYGLGILEINSGEQLLNLSNRKMNKLTYGKGGSDAEDFLLQEGVPTALFWDQMVVEPVAYCANGRVGGWFYRANSRKGPMENLNSPSSLFIPPSDISDTLISSRRNHWHTLVAEISMLGMASETDSFL
tara:strand:- start:312 stop:1340 length:1029 start_codon:yes stop_codon:yes gene_type:complete